MTTGSPIHLVTYIPIPDCDWIPPLRTCCRAVLRREKATPNSSLTVVLSDDAHLRALNQKFRGIDAATDVLSFSAVEGAVPADGYWGDVVISVERASAQASIAGHSVLAELQLLAIHGVLHLLGYDHDTVVNHARMWAAQATVVEALGIRVTIPE